MTSLFRRSSSSNGGSRSGGGGGGGDGEGGPLNNSRPNRQVRRLEFNQAMEDFKTMFPSMDYEVIECVLRSNNGAVDATIDQLLQMSIDGQGSDDSSDSDDSIPPEILERTLEPDSSDEEPPPVYSPPAYDMHIYDRKYPEAPPTPPPRFEAEPLPAHTQARSYRNWNPPLLGNLPDDFLRILPQQLDSIKSSQSSLSQPSSSSSSSVSSISQWTTHSSSQPGGAGTAGGPGLPAGATEQDKKLKQYLEDERIALFLQNEEFMRELQRNREFLIALERDRLKYESKRSKSTHSSSLESSTGDQCSAASTEAVSDDALFQDKLKHMGKSTRKKLFEIARTFSEKTKRRKSKRKVLLKHHSYPPEPCSPRSLYATAALLFLNAAPPQAGHRRLHRQPPGRRRGERRRRRRPAETSRHSGSEGAGRRAGIMILPLHHIRVPMASRPTCAGGSLSPPTPDL